MNVNGLGDVVEKFAKATGMKAAADAIARATGKDCGCKKRRDALNRLLPFGKDRTDGVQPEQD